MSDQDSASTTDEEVTTVYVVYDDGSIDKITYSGSDMPPLSKPGRVTDEAEYLARLAQLEAQNAAHVDDLQRAAQAQAKADYDALRAAGIPEATARRLSGYTGA